MNGTIKANTLTLLQKELEHIGAAYGGFASAYEGYAVMLEQAEDLQEEIGSPGGIMDNLDWLWRDIKLGTPYRTDIAEQIEASAVNAAGKAILLAAHCRKLRESSL